MMSVARRPTDDPFRLRRFHPAALYYVFFFPGEVYAGEEKTRLGYLRERKEAVYENLRDLNFEYKAGKVPDADYQSMRASLEEEAAAIMAEIARLEQAAGRQNCLHRVIPSEARDLHCSPQREPQ
jgi:hypothetical protein